MLSNIQILLVAVLAVIAIGCFLAAFNEYHKVVSSETMISSQIKNTKMTKRYYAKSESKVEKALQEVEQVLQKHGLSINQSYNGLSITHEGQTYQLVDTESRTGCSYLPRGFEGERLLIEKD